MNIDWDSNCYSEDFSFVPTYGKDVQRLCIQHLKAYSMKWA